MASLREVLPGVRHACDAYVDLIRERSLLEGVAASLTEMHAPDLMSRRIEAFERHYGFEKHRGLDYFSARLEQAKRDADFALTFVGEHATTRALQAACMNALVCKTDLLWQILDSIDKPLTSSGQHVAVA
jgi:pyrroloquinoline-quinone synthase